MFFIKKIFFSIMFTMMFQTFDASRRRFPRNDAEVSQKLLIENISELYACLEDNPNNCRRVNSIKVDPAANKNCYTDTISIAFNITSDKVTATTSGYLTEDMHILTKSIDAYSNKVNCIKILSKT